MKNRIAILIEEKYGDMRSSEKQAADYVLAHMDKVRELSLESWPQTAESASLRL